MRLHRSQANRGHTLVLVLVFSGILTALLIGFLRTLNNANLLTARSLSWNNSLPIAEAGIEEASSAICSISYGQDLTAMLQSAGWTANGNSLSRSRDLTNAYYAALITSSNTAFAIGPTNPPVICSTGFVRVATSGAYVSRPIRVTTKY